MVQIKTILCALDFSEVSPKVASYAKSLAEVCGAKVIVLYVAPSLTQYVEFHVQASYIDEIIKTLESGGTLSEKTIIMDEKGFDASTITQEDVDNYGI